MTNGWEDVEEYVPEYKSVVAPTKQVSRKPKPKQNQKVVLKMSQIDPDFDTENVDNSDLCSEANDNDQTSSDKSDISAASDSSSDSDNGNIYIAKSTKTPKIINRQKLKEQAEHDSGVYTILYYSEYDFERDRWGDTVPGKGFYYPLEKPPFSAGEHIDVYDKPFRTRLLSNLKEKSISKWRSTFGQNPFQPIFDGDSECKSAVVSRVAHCAYDLDGGVSIVGFGLREYTRTFTGSDEWLPVPLAKDGGVWECAVSKCVDKQHIGAGWADMRIQPDFLRKNLALPGYFSNADCTGSTQSSFSKVDGPFGIFVRRDHTGNSATLEAQIEHDSGRRHVTVHIDYLRIMSGSGSIVCNFCRVACPSGDILKLWKCSKYVESLPATLDFAFFHVLTAANELLIYVLPPRELAKTVNSSFIPFRVGFDLSESAESVFWSPSGKSLCVWERRGEQSFATFLDINVAILCDLVFSDSASRLANANLVSEIQSLDLGLRIPSQVCMSLDGASAAISFFKQGSNLSREKVGFLHNLHSGSEFTLSNDAKDTTGLLTDTIKVYDLKTGKSLLCFKAGSDCPCPKICFHPAHAEIFAILKDSDYIQFINLKLLLADLYTNDLLAFESNCSDLNLHEQRVLKYSQILKSYGFTSDRCWSKEAIRAFQWCLGDNALLQFHSASRNDNAFTRNFAFEPSEPALSVCIYDDTGDFLAVRALNCVKLFKFCQSLPCLKTLVKQQIKGAVLDNWLVLPHAENRTAYMLGQYSVRPGNISVSSSYSSCLRQKNEPELFRTGLALTNPTSLELKGRFYDWLEGRISQRYVDVLCDS